MEEYMVPCMNKSIFGIDCMGCGIQRSLLLFLDGEFVSAFEMFPALYSTFLFFIVVFLHFVDKSRNYLKLLIVAAVFNSLILLIAYAYKMRFLY
jgi:hypothetical protein